MKETDGMALLKLTTTISGVGGCDGGCTYTQNKSRGRVSAMGKMWEQAVDCGKKECEWVSQRPRENNGGSRCYKGTTGTKYR